MTNILDRNSHTLNGKPITNPWILRKDIMRGGTLRLVMGKETNN